MFGRNSPETVMLFANPPVPDDLCAVTLFVQKRQNAEPAFRSQIIRCRELIFTEPEIIATPSLDFDNSFYIIMRQSLYKTGRLQNRFIKSGLDASKPYRATPVLYESCLRYTLTAKLAPQWNKAGEWMVQGRDFLTNRGYANAVNINLKVNKDELYLSVLASAVRFPPLELQHLCLDDHQINSFLQSAENKHHKIPITDNWCHVLPSMKRGMILSVSRSLPDDGPFTSYRDFKRHWKNTYGYRLPDTDDDMLYYEVTFWYTGGGKIFTYPGVCLRAANIQQIPRVDYKPILVSFIQDLHSKMSLVCGHQLRFQPKIKYAIPELYSCFEEKMCGTVNLTNKNPVVKNVPLRNINDIQHLYNPNRLTTDETKKQISPNYTGASSNGVTNSTTPEHYVPQSNTDTQSHSTSNESSTTKKIIPVFHSKAAARYIPSNSLSASSFKAGNEDNSRASNVSHQSKIVPSFNSSNLVSSRKTSVKVVNNFNNKNKIIYSANRKLGRDHQLNILNKHNSSSQMSNEFTSHLLNKNSTNLLLADTLTSDGRKRKGTKMDKDSDIKKPRPRQQIQDVDVKLLAKNNQLEKVNAATLVAWLKERGVPCKSKDKKGDLMDRVKHILCLSQHET